MNTRSRRRSIHIFRIGIFLLTALPFASSVLACRYSLDALDNRPLAKRLVEAPIAFIGTVTRVNTDGAGTVEFQVEHLLHGVVEGQRFVAEAGDSSCDIRFSIGQRWIYGGATLFHPSVLLDQLKTLSRLDDTKLAFPVEWQKCNSDSVCSTLPYGCTKTAVNTTYLPQATDKAFDVGGDPRALECKLSDNEFERPLCEQNKCGIWVLPGN